MTKRDFVVKCVAAYMDAVDRSVGTFWHPGITDKDVEKVRRFREVLAGLDEVTG